MLGIAYRMQGSPELTAEARAELVQALALKPELLPARVYLAQLYLDIGRAGTAKEALTTGLAQRPDDPQLLAAAGRDRTAARSPRARDRACAPGVAAGRIVRPGPLLSRARVAGSSQARRGDRRTGTGRSGGAESGRPESCPRHRLPRRGTRRRSHPGTRQGTTIDPSRADMRIVLARALRTKGLLDKADAELVLAKPKTAASGTPQFSQQQPEPDFYMELGLLRRRAGPAAGGGPGVPEGARVANPIARTPRVSCRRSAACSRAVGGSRPGGCGVITARWPVLLLLLLLPVSIASQSPPRAAARRGARDTAGRHHREIEHQLRPPVGRIARQAHGRDVRFRRGVDRLRQRRLPRSLSSSTARRAPSNALYHNNKRRHVHRCHADGRRRRHDGGPASFKTGVAVGDYDNDGYLDLYVTAFGPNILYRNNGDGTFTDVTAERGRCRRRERVEHQHRVLRLRSRRRSRPLRRQLPRLPPRRQPVLRPAQAGLPDVLPSDDVRRHGRSAVSQQRRRHLHRRLEGRPASPIRPAKASASRSATSIATATPTSTSPTTRSAISSIATTATARSSTSPMAPASASTRTAKPQAGHGHRLRATSTATACRTSSSPISRRSSTRSTRIRGDGHLRRRVGEGRPRVRRSCRSASAPSCSTSTTTAISTSTSPTGTSSTTSSCISRRSRYAQKDLLYENLGGTFRDVSEPERAGAPGAPRRPRTRRRRLRQRRQISTSSSPASDERPVLLKNQSVRTGNWLTIRAQGTKSNTFGLGATVPVETADGVQVREINNVASYLSSNDIRLHFGLGTAKTIAADRHRLAERHASGPERRRRQPGPGGEGTVRRIVTVLPRGLAASARPDPARRDASRCRRADRPAASGQGRRLAACRSR